MSVEQLRQGTERAWKHGLFVSQHRAPDSARRGRLAFTRW